jgi:hypothetical protein
MAAYFRGSVFSFPLPRFIATIIAALAFSFIHSSMRGECLSPSKRLVFLMGGHLHFVATE